MRRLHTVQGSIDYTQGWSWVMAVLLCFSREPEEAFWMFVVMCEEILAKDFYARPPGGLNGAIVEGRVVETIIMEEWGDCYDNEELKQVAKMLTIKLGK